MRMVVNRQGRQVPWEWANRAEHERIWRDQTIKTDEFAKIVDETLMALEPLSAVRMSDGEDDIIYFCATHRHDELMRCFPDEWNERFGTTGILCGEMARRLRIGGTEATYFAPDGERNHLRQHFPLRDKILHILYPDLLTIDQKARWFGLAGHVAVLNGSVEYTNQIRDRAPTGVTVTHIIMRNWTEQDQAIEQAKQLDAPLVLWSGGPAGKYIGPELAKAGKVAIDIGHAMRTWWGHPPTIADTAEREYIRECTKFIEEGK